MIYPIYAYGSPVLKKEARDIEKDGDVDVKQLAEDMFETMYAASGVGLAGPQIGLDLRIFVVDAEPMDEENLQGFKKVFINAQILEETGDDWGFEEGCLSIPNIREEVIRPEKVKINYFDENWEEHTEEFDGLAARVIQHEYDHIDGILFTDHLSAFKKRLLKGKLVNISKGKVKHDYKMKFPVRK
ncbi:peptide deformylase [Flexithrix dorotheae]|uniref:peptide deformylase n=1 Tax=Flexithrix dorotheae TaxID=70993 RepID=UPI0004761310|nr:peptide deformylase [Flexithrix dorotheae]